MRKNPQQTQITRQNIIDAYCILSKSEKKSQITVKSLSEKAGYNRSTFYDYFNDVYDVQEQIQDFVIDHIQHNLKDNFRTGKLENSFIKSFDDLHAHFPNYYDVIFTGTTDVIFTNRLKNTIKIEIKNKYQLTNLSIEEDYAIDFFVSGAIAIICSWINHNRNISASQLGKLIRSLVESGIGEYLPK
ncbi:TetR/AcrR family transcriptional regulator [Companilactobacillus nantensis]|uniref:HTH tetR-type domain-containing protein n=1 Tax=Companilactobacillus nantensis DSM 16982 TaxID=1423774 RepID=A0A0R1WCX0_9LACO|nr:TetR/AcrR family transcriptional regulator [Companilactobacillus nantensis]KRM15687.1 hypothetical protein FD31_GL001107 [Companilactobacillus nantensis DSM 16982]GEO64645.1 TetR family transcriptional regulator [Companilactobacillus nantensis]